MRITLPMLLNRKLHLNYKLSFIYYLVLTSAVLQNIVCL